MAQNNMNASQSQGKSEEFSRQTIFYGAPGTGKSHKIDDLSNNPENRIRTTFHPDSDYSTFVGAYKPMMEDDKIIYSFVPQAFLKAYVEAWKRKCEGNDKPYFLIIEEINRGNCAQIFGDLFQLLDRDDNGMSKYEISPDEDVRRYLEKEFSKLNFGKLKDAQPKSESGKPEERKINYDKIKSGEEMRLPDNLYIWATMNTSDQSLFPIDSAFKRRWDWEYIPIKKSDPSYAIEIGTMQYDWWDFIETINEKIGEVTQSEDKKMGYWFVKPTDGTTITMKQFRDKVLFYLWNDVFKDFASGGNTIFKTQEVDKDKEDAKETPFTSFFGDDEEVKLQAFMRYNEIKPKTTGSSVGNSNGQTGKTRPKKYNVNRNNTEKAGMGQAAAKAVEVYADNNKNKTLQEIADDWNNELGSLWGKSGKFIIISDKEQDRRRWIPVVLENRGTLDGGTLYVSNQFTDRGEDNSMFGKFCEIVKNKFGITITPQSADNNEATD